MKRNYLLLLLLMFVASCEMGHDELDSVTVQDADYTVTNVADPKGTNTLDETLAKALGADYSYNPEKVSRAIKIKGTINQNDFRSLQPFSEIDLGDVEVVGDIYISYRVIQTGNAIPCYSALNFTFDNLTKITLPSTITTIGDQAFMSAKKLTGVAIPASVNVIRTRAFEDCDAMTLVYVENRDNGSVPVIMENGLPYEFRVASQLDETPTEALRVNVMDNSGTKFRDADTGWELYGLQSNSEGEVNSFYTKVIYDTESQSSNLDSKLQALYGTNYQTAEPFETVEVAGDIAEGDVTYLQNFKEVVLTDATIYEGSASIAGLATRADEEEEESGVTPTNLIKDGAWKGNSVLSRILLPNSVTTIGESAFEGAVIDTVALPASLVTIKGKAFASIETLIAIDMSGSKNLALIESESFTGAANLIRVVLPGEDGNLRVINDNAFASTGVIRIEIPTTVIYIGETIFNECADLETVVVKWTEEEDIAISPTSFISAEQAATQALTIVVPTSDIDEVDGSSIYNQDKFIDTETTTLVSAEIDAANTTITNKTAGGLATRLNALYPGFLDSVQDEITVAGPLNADDLAVLQNIKSLDISGAEMTSGTITASAFEGNSTLESIVLPTTITGIEASAFASTTKLTSIELPGSLESIAEKAFYNSSITAVTLSNVTVDDIIDIVTFKLTCSLKSIGASAFEGSKLTTLILPYTIETIADRAFYGISTLEKIYTTWFTDIPSVTAEVFPAEFVAGASKQITVPDGVGGAYNKAAGWPSYTIAYASGEVVDGYSIECTTAGTLDAVIRESIGDYTTSISTRTINVSGTINAADFAALQYFAGVNISKVVIDGNSLPADAFKGNTSLKSLAMPALTTTIGSYALSGTSALTTIELPLLLTTIEEGALSSTAITSIELGEYLTTIGAKAFQSSKLTSITFPISVTSIGAEAFDSCSSLASITAVWDLETRPASVTDTSFVAGSTITVANGTGLLYLVGRNNPWATYYIVEEDGTVIDTKLVVVDATNTAGSLDASMKTMFGDSYKSTLTKKLAVIGSINAADFAALQNVAELNLSSVTLVGESEDAAMSIPASAFASAELTKITLPSTTEIIEEKAFNGCSGLAEVDWSECTALTTIESYAFAGTCLSSVDDLPVSMESIADYAFSGNTDITSIDLSGLENLTSFSGFDNTGVNSIALPESVVSIGNAFAGCTDPLGEIDWSDLKNLESISGTFALCELTSIKLPASLQTIGESTFEGCSAFTAISNYSELSLSYIGAKAFKDCSVLTEAYFSSSATIEQSTYASTAITEAVIPSCVESIAGDAFASCAYLTDVTVMRATAPAVNVGMGSDLGYSFPNQFLKVGYGDVFLAEPYTFKVIELSSALSSYESAEDWACYGGFEYMTSNTGTGWSGATLNTGAGSMEDWLSDPAANNNPVIKITGTMSDADFSTLGDSDLFTEIDLSEVQYLDNVTCALPGSAWYQNATIEKLTLPSTTKSIGANAIYQVYALTELVTSNLYQLTTINTYGIADCDLLESIEFPSTLETIAINGMRAFSLLGDLDFSECSNLSSIGYMAFAWNYGTTAITFPTVSNNGLSLDCQAFYYNSALTAVDLPTYVTFVLDSNDASQAFYNCSALNYVRLYWEGDEILEIEDTYQIFPSDYEAGGTKNILIPTGSMDDYVAKGWDFYNLVEYVDPSELGGTIDGENVKVTSPGNLASLATQVVGDRIKVSGIIGQADVQALGALNKFSYVDYSSVLIVGDVNVSSSKIVSDGSAFPMNAFSSELTSSTPILSEILLPPGILTLGENAFRGCTSLSSIDVSKVQTFRSYSMYDCDGVYANLDISSAIVLNTYALSGIAFETIHLPASLTTIDANALTSSEIKRIYVWCPSTVTPDNSAFGTAIDGFYIVVPSSDVTAFKSAPGWSSYYDYIVAEEDLTDAVVTEGYIITTSNMGSINNTVLSQLTEDKVKVIGDLSDYDLKMIASAGKATVDLTDASIPNNTLTSAMYYTTGMTTEVASELEYLYLPNNDTDDLALIIGANALRGCTNLKEIYGMGRVTTYNNNAINSSAGALMSIDLTNATSIGTSAISGSATTGAASEVVVPETMVTLNNNGLNNLSIKTVYLNAPASITYGTTPFGTVANRTGTGFMIIVDDPETYGAITNLKEYYEAGMIVTEIPTATVEIDGSTATITPAEAGQLLSVFKLYNEAAAVESLIINGGSTLNAEDMSILGETAAKYIDLTAVVLENNTLNAGTFKGNRDIISISLPASTTTIEASAFENATKFYSLTAEGATSYGERAFMGTAMQSATINAGTTYVGSNAFGDDNMRRIYMNNSATGTTYGENPFGLVSSFTSDKTDPDGVFFAITLAKGSVITDYTSIAQLSQYANDMYVSKDGPVTAENVTAGGLEQAIFYATDPGLNVTGAVISGTLNSNDLAWLINQSYKSLDLSGVTLDGNTFYHGSTYYTSTPGGNQGIPEYYFSNRGMGTSSEATTIGKSLTWIKLPEGLTHGSSYLFTDSQVENVYFPETCLTVSWWTVYNGGNTAGLQNVIFACKQVMGYSNFKFAYVVDSVCTSTRLYVRDDYMATYMSNSTYSATYGTVLYNMSELSSSIVTDLLPGGVLPDDLRPAPTIDGTTITINVKGTLGDNNGEYLDAVFDNNAGSEEKTITIKGAMSDDDLEVLANMSSSRYFNVIDFSATTFDDDEISYALFKNNTYITSVSLPSAITEIAKEGFSGASNLASLTTTDITVYGESALAGTAITAITLGESVTAVGSMALSSASTLDIKLTAPSTSSITFGESPFGTASSKPNMVISIPTGSTPAEYIAAFPALAEYSGKFDELEGVVVDADGTITVNSYATFSAATVQDASTYQRTNSYITEAFNNQAASTEKHLTVIGDIGQSELYCLRSMAFTHIDLEQARVVGYVYSNATLNNNSALSYRYFPGFVFYSANTASAEFGEAFTSGNSTLQEIVLPSRTTYLSNHTLRNCTALTKVSGTCFDNMINVLQYAFAYSTSLESVPDMPSLTTFNNVGAFQKTKIGRFNSSGLITEYKGSTFEEITNLTVDLTAHGNSGANASPIITNNTDSFYVNDATKLLIPSAWCNDDGSYTITNLSTWNLYVPNTGVDSYTQVNNVVADETTMSIIYIDSRGEVTDEIIYDSAAKTLSAVTSGLIEDNASFLATLTSSATSITLGGTLSAGDVAAVEAVGITILTYSTGTTVDGEEPEGTAFEGIEMDGTTITTDEAGLINATVLAVVSSSAGDEKSITIKGYVNTDDLAALASYNTFTSVDLSGAEIKGDAIFTDYTALSSITLPASVTSIAARAFEGCVGITSFDLTGIVSVGEAAFKDSGLTTMTAGSTLATLAANAFNTVVEADLSALSAAAAPTGATTTTFAEGCAIYLAVGGYTSSGSFDAAPWNTADLWKMYEDGALVFPVVDVPSIPNVTFDASTVKVAAEGAIAADTSYAGLIVEYMKKASPTPDCLVFEGKMSSADLHAFRDYTTSTFSEFNFADVVFNSGTVFPANAFSTATSTTAVTSYDALVKVTLPTGTTEIGSDAFNCCAALITVEMDNFSTLATLGARAFYTVATFTNADIFTGLKTISSNALSNTGMTSYTAPSTLRTVGSNAVKSKTLLDINFTACPDDFDSYMSFTTSSFYNDASCVLTVPAAWESSGFPSKIGLSISIVYWTYEAPTVEYTGLTLKSYTINVETAGSLAAYADSSEQYNEILTEAYNSSEQGTETKLIITGTVNQEDLFQLRPTKFNNIDLSGITAISGDIVYNGTTTGTTKYLPAYLFWLNSSTAGSNAWGEIVESNNTLQTFALPKCATIIGTYAFQNCTALESITNTSYVLQLHKYSFNGCNLIDQEFLESFTSLQVIWNYGISSSNLTKYAPPASIKGMYVNSLDKSGLKVLDLRNCTSSTVSSFSNIRSTSLPADCIILVDSDADYDAWAGIYASSTIEWTSYNFFEEQADDTFSQVNSIDGTWSVLDSDGVTTLVSYDTESDMITSSANGNISAYASTIAAWITADGASAVQLFGSFSASTDEVAIKEACTAVTFSYATGAVVDGDIYVPSVDIVGVTFNDTTSTVELSSAGLVAANTIDILVYSYTKYGSTLTISGPMNQDDFYAVRDCSTKFEDVDYSAVEINGTVNVDTTLSSTTVTSDAGKSIPESIFNGYTSLKTIALPKNSTTGDYITEIGVSSFLGCSALTSVTNTSAVVKLYKNTFQNCTVLDLAGLTSQITSLNNNTFYGSGLTKFTANSDLTWYGQNSLYTETLTEADLSAYGSSCLLTALNITKLTFHEDCVITVPDEWTWESSAYFSNTNLITTSEGVTTYTLAYWTLKTKSGEAWDGKTALYDSTGGDLGGSTDPGTDPDTDSAPEITGVEFDEEGKSVALSAAGLLAADDNAASILEYCATLDADKLIITGIMNQDDFYAIRDCSTTFTEIDLGGVTIDGGTVFPTYAFSTYETTGTTGTAYTSLTKITLPAGTTEIGASAFSRCSSLATVAMADYSTLTTLNGYALYNATSFTNADIFTALAAVNASALQLTGMTSYTAPASLKTLGSNAIKNSKLIKYDLTACDADYSKMSITTSSLQSNDNVYVNVPASWMKYSISAIANGTRNVVYCDTNGDAVTALVEDSTIYTSETGAITSDIVSNISGDAVIVAGEVSSADLAEINNDGGFTSVDLSGATLADNTITSSDGFCNNAIKTLVVPANTTLGDQALSGAANLSSLNTDDIVYYGNSALSSTAITAVTIGTNVTAIGDYALNNVSEVTFSAAASEYTLTIGSNPFKSDVKIYIPEDEESSNYTTAWSNLSSYEFATVGEATATVSGGTVTTTEAGQITATVLDEVFTTNLQTELTVVGPANQADMQAISGYAFTKLDLSEVEFSNNIFPDNSFSTGSSNTSALGAVLTDVVLPEKLTEIGQFAFANCKKLNIPTPATALASITTLGNYAFYNALLFVDLSGFSALKTMNQFAFTNAAFTSYTAPASLTTIQKKSLYSTTSGVVIDLSACSSSYSGMSLHSGTTAADTPFPKGCTIYVPTGWKGDADFNATIANWESTNVYAGYNIVYGAPTVVDPTYTGLTVDLETLTIEVTTAGALADYYDADDATNYYNKALAAVYNSSSQSETETKLILKGAVSPGDLYQLRPTKFNNIDLSGVTAITGSGYTSSTSAELDGNTIPGYIFYATSGVSLGVAVSENTTLKTITLPSASNFVNIGYYAFKGCSALETVNNVSNITALYQFSFSGCSLLDGSDLEKFTSLKTFWKSSYNDTAITSYTAPATLIAFYTEVMNSTNLATLYLTNHTTAAVAVVGSSTDGSIQSLPLTCNVLINSSKVAYSAWTGKDAEWADYNVFDVDGDYYIQINSLGDTKSVLDSSAAVAATYDTTTHALTSSSEGVIAANVETIATWIGSDSYTIGGQYSTADSDALTAKIAAASATFTYDEATLTINVLNAGALAADATGVIGTIYSSKSQTSGSEKLILTGKMNTADVQAIRDYANATFTEIDMDGVMLYDEDGAKSTVFPENSFATGDKVSYTAYTSLVTIKLPSGTTKIGAYAFIGCTALATINMDDFSTLTTLDSYALYATSSLTSIDNMIALVEVGSSALQTSGLTSFTAPASFTTTKSNALKTKSNITFDLSACGDYSTMDLNNTTFTANTYVIIIVPANWANQTTLFEGSVNSDYSWANGRTIQFADAGGTTTTDLAQVTSTTITTNATEQISQDLLFAVYENGSSSGELLTIEGKLSAADIQTIRDYEHTFAKIDLSGAALYSGEAEVTEFPEYSFYRAADADNSITAMSYTALKEISLPSNVTSIGQYAFYGCSSLATVSCAEGQAITSLANYAFYGCSALSDSSLATLTASAVSLANSAMRSCTSLTYFVAPATLLTYAGNVFNSCSALAYADFTAYPLTATLKSFASSIFPGTTKILLPAGCFADTSCELYTSVSTGNAKWNMYESYGTNLVQVNTIDGTYSVLDSSFDALVSYDTATDELTSAMEGYITTYANEIAAWIAADEATAVTIAGTLSSDDKSAIEAVSSANFSVAAGAMLDGKEQEGESTSYLDGQASFNGAVLTLNAAGVLASDTEHEVLDVVLASGSTLALSGPVNQADLQSIRDYDGSTFTKLDLSRVTFYDTSGNITTVLPEYAFATTYNASSTFSGTLAEVVLPTGLTSIGQYAFSNFKKIYSITPAEALSSITSIGQYVFYQAKALTNADDFSGIVTLSQFAFGNSGLLSYTAPSSLTTINKKSLLSSSAIEIDLTACAASFSAMSISVDDIFYGDCTIYVPSSWEGDSSFESGIAYAPWKGNNIVYGTSIRTASAGSLSEAMLAKAYANGGSTGKLTISGSMNQADMHTIRDYSGATFTQIDLSGVTLYDNDGVKSTTMPASSFLGYPTLTSITLPAGTTEIGAEAFDGCSSLSAIGNLDAVAVLGASSLEGTGFTAFTAPASLTTMGALSLATSSAITFDLSACGLYSTMSIDASTFSASSAVKIICPASWDGMDGLANGTTSTLAWASGRTIEIFAIDYNDLTLSAYTINVESAGALAAYADSSEQGNEILTAAYNSAAQVSKTKLILTGTVNQEDLWQLRPTKFNNIDLSGIALSGEAVILNSSTVTATSSSNVTKILPAYTFYASSATTTISEETYNLGSVVTTNTTLEQITLPSTFAFIGYSAFRGCSALHTINGSSAITQTYPNSFYGCDLLDNDDLNAMTSMQKIWKQSFDSQLITSYTAPTTLTNLYSSALAETALAVLDLRGFSSATITLTDTTVLPATCGVLVDSDVPYSAWNTKDTGWASFNFFEEQADGTFSQVNSIDGTWSVLDSDGVTTLVSYDTESDMITSSANGNISAYASTIAAWITADGASAVQLFGSFSASTDEVAIKEACTAVTFSYATGAVVDGTPYVPSVTLVNVTVSGNTVTLDSAGAVAADAGFAPYIVDQIRQNVGLDEIIFSGKMNVSDIQAFRDYTTSTFKKMDFSGVTNLTTFPSEALSSEDGSKAYPLEEVVLPTGTTKINTYAFNNCTSLKTISVAGPSLITEISKQALCNTAISDVSQFDGVTNYGNSALAGTKLTSFTAPASLVKIWGSALNTPTLLDVDLLACSSTYSDMTISGDAYFTAGCSVKVPATWRSESGWQTVISSNSSLGWNVTYGSMDEGTTSYTATPYNSTLYTKVEGFSDEFDGSTLDTDKWDAPNDAFATWVFDEENVSFEDGKMLLTATYNNQTVAYSGSTREYYFTSGMLRSKTTRKYGYYEAKVKGADVWPDSDDWQGLCSAFWLYSKGIECEKEEYNVTYNEIDVMELQQIATNKRMMACNLHLYNYQYSNGSLTNTSCSAGMYPTMGQSEFLVDYDPEEDYHIYACENRPDSIVFYIDNVRVAAKPNFFHHLDQGMYVTLSLGMRTPYETYDGGTRLPVATTEEEARAAGFPIPMYVDYIRVYERDYDDFPAE
ncbi:MAG: leucine-rich repeat protein, partial [Rikenellaceae bacterium]